MNNMTDTHSLDGLVDSPLAGKENGSSEHALGELAPDALIEPPRYLLLG